MSWAGSVGWSVPLHDEEVPVLVTMVALESFDQAEFLAHEVPDVYIPAETLAAMPRAARTGGERIRSPSSGSPESAEIAQLVVQATAEPSSLAGGIGALEPELDRNSTLASTSTPQRTLCRRVISATVDKVVGRRLRST